MLNLLRHIILFPVYLLQAAYAYAFIPRLPEPMGDRQIRLGQGRPMRLVVIGDSSAAGVGTDTQEQGLLGQLTHNLSRDWTVTATLWAQSGGTVASTLRMLNQMPPQEFDVAVVSLGINDAKNGVRFQNWLAGYTQLIDRLQTRHKVPMVLVSGLAPIRDFPALPTPLRHMLGDRAEWFDTSLQNMVASLPNTTYLPLDLKMDVTKMSRDGFHPGPEVYAIWARRVASGIRAAMIDAKPPSRGRGQTGQSPQGSRPSAV